MEPNLGKPKSGQSTPIELTSDPKWVAWRDSRSEPKERLECPKEADEGDILQYHLTARIVNSQLSVRHLSLILEVLEYQIVHWDCNFAMFLTLVELYQRIKGSAPSAYDINDGKIRLTALVAEIIIEDLGDKEFSLGNQDFVQLSGTVRELLSEYVMDKRTYGSRYSHWRPERWIRVRAVPVETIYERPRNSANERYSSYTKGYGESHGNAHRNKTKPSSELDGETDWPDKTERNLILVMTDWIHQKANRLWINWKNLSK